MSNQKTEMREAALRYVVEHGVANVSLRPLAEAIGTSPRMLLFYFQSKEGLLQALMEELQDRLRASFVEEVASATDRDPRQPIKRFWDWAIKGQNSAYLRLFYEVQVIAAQNPAQYGRHFESISSEWQALAFGVLSDSVRSPAMATLCIAVFDGLFLDFMMTGDRERLTGALDLFIDVVRPRR